MPGLLSYMYCEVIDFFQILPSTKAAPNSSQSKIAMTRTSILLSSLTNSVSGCTLTNFCFSQKDAVAQQISDILERRGMMEDFLRILKQQDGEVTAFSEKLWCGLLDYATAYADGRMTFTFKNGSTFEG